MRARQAGIILIFIMAAVVLNGCSTTRLHTMRFYLLKAVDEPQKAGTPACPGANVLSLGINRVELPKYLDRPQIMTRAGNYEMKLTETHLWAEPLEDSISRVMVKNLSSLVCADLKPWPWRASDSFDRRLNTRVILLDGTFGGDAVLDVQWSIVDEHTKKVLVTKESKFAEKIEHGSYESLVSAYSRLVASFSREIADSLARLDSGKPAGQKQE